MMVTMNINDITMPVSYSRTPPHKEKINSHMMYYLEHGKLKSNITVTQKGMLLDGYCDYIVAVVCGMDKVECELNMDILRRDLRTRNRKIRKSSNKRKILYQRQDGKCAICGKQLQIEDSMNKENYLTFDHILPVCRGGSNSLENLQGLCWKCNQVKDNLIESDSDAEDNVVFSL